MISILFLTLTAVALLLSMVLASIRVQTAHSAVVPSLGISADVPSNLGPSTTGAIIIHYSNAGTTDMQAPVLVLHGGSKSLLTLDKSKSGSALDTTAFPHGYTDNVQIMASGQNAGVLKAGESVDVPVYFCGLVKPWDPNQTQVTMTISSYETNDATSIDWSSLKLSMKPDSIDSLG